MTIRTTRRELRKIIREEILKESVLAPKQKEAILSNLAWAQQTLEGVRMSIEYEDTKYVAKVLGDTINHLRNALQSYENFQRINQGIE